MEAISADTYDMKVLNAMMQVEETFSEMVCDCYGVEDEEELPKEIQDIDVVKFAQLSHADISSIVTKVLEKHLKEDQHPKIQIIIATTVNAIQEHKAKNMDVWPGDHGKRGPDAPKKTMQFDASAGEKESAAKKFMTGKYDFKIMRKLTAIENKFLDTLCGLYGVEDEDELPAEIQEISLGEMFEAGTPLEEIRTRMEGQLKLKPYEGMDDAALSEMVGEVCTVLEPLFASAIAAGEATLKAEAAAAAAAEADK
jgi:hypothetical protein